MKTRNICKYRLKKKYVLKWYSYFYKKSRYNVGMRTEVRIYNKTMYLYNKNILELLKLYIGTEPKSMIHDRG